MSTELFKMGLHFSLAFLYRNMENTTHSSVKDKWARIGPLRICVLSVKSLSVEGGGESTPSGGKSMLKVKLC